MRARSPDARAYPARRSGTGCGARSRTDHATAQGTIHRSWMKRRTPTSLACTSETGASPRTRAASGAYGSRSTRRTHGSSPSVRKQWRPLRPDEQASIDVVEVERSTFPTIGSTGRVSSHSMGPGEKHLRPIVLDDWQERIVSANVEPFLRGLIHSDGTRIVATERKGTRMRRAPRCEFSNRSEDILKLFFHACEIAGVHCTRSSRVHMSVYSNAAVARLDQFIGPKA